MLLLGGPAGVIFGDANGQDAICYIRQSDYIVQQFGRYCQYELVERLSTGPIIRFLLTLWS